MAGRRGCRAIRGNELNLWEIAEAVEAAFCCGRIDDECAADAPRSAFVRTALYLITKQHVDSAGLSAEDAACERRESTRKVRREIAGFLGVDENEVFRLHHHAAGLRAKDEKYRMKVQGIEREMAERHGLSI